MSRQKKTAQNNLNPKRSHSESYGVEFVNIQLSADDVIALREWEVSEEEMFHAIEEWTQNGYKVSLSIDMANTGGIVALTGKRGCVPEDNTDRCLTSRGPDIRGALLSTMYKLQAYCLDGSFPHSATDRPADFS